MRYHHALCLYPYPVDRSLILGVFPPTGLEYVATALKGHVDRIDLVDLRYEQLMQSPQAMSEFIRRGADLICISVYWKSRYSKVCDYISQLPSDRTRRSSLEAGRRPKMWRTFFSDAPTLML
jgi:hypothetical protein